MSEQSTAWDNIYDWLLRTSETVSANVIALGSNLIFALIVSIVTGVWLVIHCWDTAGSPDGVLCPIVFLGGPIGAPVDNMERQALDCNWWYLPP